MHPKTICFQQTYQNASEPLEPARDAPFGSQCAGFSKYLQKIMRRGMGFFAIWAGVNDFG
jgi:hypothetical protein